MHLPFQKTNHLGEPRQLVSHVRDQSQYYNYRKYARLLSSPLRGSPQVCSKPQQIAENTSSSDFCSGTRTPAQHKTCKYSLRGACQCIAQPNTTLLDCILYLMQYPYDPGT